MSLRLRRLFGAAWGLATLGVLLCPLPAQATFSIVAVDTVTGAVGGAGASCISGSKIINDIIEGIGAVHTQAYYLAENQDNAHALLAEGLTPDSIIAWLEANDFEGTPDIRQYGVVTLAGSGASAAFTGWNTTPWAGHYTGPAYAIQGNILLGQEIVDDMETAFLNTPGPLEDKLMAALNAADVPGADKRCLSCNKPAISAFIKVVHIGDGDTPYLFTYVDNTVCSVNPMDLLRDQYSQWTLQKYPDPDSSTIEVTPMVMTADGSETAAIIVTPLNLNSEPPIAGAEVSLENSGDGALSEVIDNGDGTFSATITSPMVPGYDTVTAIATGSGQEATLTTRPVLRYIACGDANSDFSLNVADAVALITYIFKDGPAPDPLCMGDANTDAAVNIADAVYMINYVFKDGPPPGDQCCSPLW
jgi:uncharacterized Ntn-hydrolase superfamily protein